MVAEAGSQTFKLIGYYADRPLWDFKKRWITKSVEEPYRKGQFCSQSEKEESGGVQRWAELVSDQHLALRSFNKKIFTTLQPVPFARKGPGRSRLQEKQLSIFGEQKLRRREELYEKAQQAFLRPEKKNLDVVDLSTVFDGHDGVVFEDDCCHLNDQGNREILQSLIPRLKILLEESKH
ncbi:MAG: hypothetical protein HRT45_10680 [Bdellovibrionales bacterium]|nr:hypothetical protein [Bdellovibrionales bacterium]